MPGTVKVKATPLTGEYDVLVDGERVGMVRKRYEVYSGLRSGNGRGGGTFAYWDATASDGRRVVQNTYRCIHCGGEVHERVGKDDGGYRLPECLSCGYRYKYDGYAKGDKPEVVSGPQLTTEQGRDARLGANTRRDAVAVLVEAVAAAATDKAGDRGA
jgi:DNA-directed RNA polymerase subunit RPC12/RpoP